MRVVRLVWPGPILSRTPDGSIDAVVGDVQSAILGWRYFPWPVIEKVALPRQRLSRIRSLFADSIQESSREMTNRVEGNAPS